MRHGLWLSLFLVIGMTGIFAEPLNYTEMLKSKPVKVNGLEFVATTQSKWVGRASGTVRSLEIQLLITNKSGHDVIFPLFDTFFLEMIDPNGFKVPIGGGRDGTIPLPPVLIRAGETFCVARKAQLSWKVAHTDSPRDFDGKSGTLTYWDGTGSVWNFRSLEPGIYTLAFSIQSDKAAAEEMKKWAGPPVWSGKARTKDLSFEIMEETN
jgi:hypothetical protein